MKAAFIEATGAPDVIRYGDLPKPTPKDGEVRMPKGKSPLAESDIALITAWIAQGAEDDTPRPRAIGRTQGEQDVARGVAELPGQALVMGCPREVSDQLA